nr:hypothetical protein FFPRI1PSEUD_22290 [Pseudomonas sp. FFPRI_1]
MHQANERLRRQAGSYNMPASHIPPRRSWLASEAARETCARLMTAFAGKPAPTTCPPRPSLCRSWLASEEARETCTRLTIVYAVGVPSLNCRAARRAYKGLLAINCW